MPYKDHIIRAAKNKTFNLSWYQRNKDRHRETQRINRRKARDEWIEFKSSLECQKCGFKHPAAIDFHHTNPENKEGEVNNWARMVSTLEQERRLKSVYLYALTATEFCILKKTAQE